ncbi:hypothetical protein [Roseibacillus persicicus]|uniref:hypothetical protein n=1 Tax=Roseibacillus persicicus TaxID=454148 RepID=UPI00280CA5CE|nr:hypothetical protein [Roseibacillus persicicus]MDQ8189371.1 hypothetical protein [Roseibacillus persicicus]
MIKNIFYILTIILCGAAAFFGYQTKNTLSDTIGQTIETFDSNETVASNIDEKNSEIKVAKDEKKTAIDARNETSASLENESSKERGLKTSLAELEGEIESYDADLETIQTNITIAQELIGQMIPDAGGNLSIDDVVGYIEDLENERKEKESELEEKTEIAGKLAKTVAAASDRKENLQGRLGKVKSRIALNGVSASVTAVSNDYGFVIINRGSNNSNIDERSELLVSRGGSLVGRLKVSAVEPTQTICDIIQSSLKPGQRIRSGDRVVVKVPASN